MKKLLLGLAILLMTNFTFLAPQTEAGIMGFAGKVASEAASNIGGSLLTGAQNIGSQALSSVTNAASGIVTGAIGAVVSSASNALNQVITGGINKLFGGDKGAGLPDGKFELPDANEYNTIGQNISIREFILKVLNFVLTFLGLIAIVAIVYAGYLMVLSGGDDANPEKGKKIILYAVIGMIVILVSYAIVNTVLNEAIKGGDDRGAVGSGGALTLNEINTGGDGGTLTLNEFNLGENGQLNTNDINLGDNSGQLDINEFNLGKSGELNRNRIKTGKAVKAGIQKNADGSINVPTKYAPLQVLPGGTKLGVGITLPKDTTVNPDGTVTIPSTEAQEALNELTENTSDPLEDLFNFQNGITVSGEGVRDFGDTVIIPNSLAKSGINFGLSVKGIAKFDFQDGIILDLDTLNQEGATLNHKFPPNSESLVRAVVRIPDGSVQQFSKKIIVGGVEPKIITNKRELFVGETLKLDGTTSVISIGGLQNMTWSCEGGSGCFASLEAGKMESQFKLPGHYTITLEIENTIGIKEKTSIGIDIVGEKPLAGFIVETIDDVSKPSTVLIKGQYSLGINGRNSEITKYLWEIEGEPIETLRPEIRHTFKTKGIKEIGLVVTQTVRGNTLESDAVSTTINIENVLNPDFQVTQ